MPSASAARRGLTGRSRGRATARQPARAAHRPIMRRTGGLPCCRAPLNSALGSTERSDEVLGQQSLKHPAAAPTQLSKSSLARCLRLVASPAKRPAPARTWPWRPAWLPRSGQAARPASRCLTICHRCQSSFTGRAACAPSARYGRAVQAARRSVVLPSPARRRNLGLVSAAALPPPSRSRTPQGAA